MSYHSLADFLEELGQAGQLARVSSEVDPVLEIAQISDRVARTDGKALLFGSVRASGFSVVTNLLADPGRICRVLGVESAEELSQRIGQLLRSVETDGWIEKIKGTATRADLRKLEPRIVRTGACQQVVRLGADVDLGRLPALQTRPGELGRIITAGQLLTSPIEPGGRCVGRHSLRILDRSRMVVAWSAEDDIARCWEGYRQRRLPMPVAVVLGGDPALLLAAMAPLPPDHDRLAFAGLLRGKALDLVRCRSLELEVPAEAELVLEGFVDPDQPEEETGPIAAPGGYLIPSRPMPVMHVSAITHRSNPVFPAIVPGCSSDETNAIQRVLHRVFLPVVQSAVPELMDYDVPTLGVSGRVVLASIAKSYAGQARKVACSLWGLRQLMFAKLLVIVDADVNVRDPQQVWSAVAARTDFGRDLLFVQGPLDLADPAAMPGSLGQRLAIDATRKLPDEGARQAASPAEMPDEIQRLVSLRWAEYGLGELR